MAEYVCRTCHRVLEGKSCSHCGTEVVSADWTGYVIVLDPEKSQIARRLNVSSQGKYALKVR